MNFFSRKKSPTDLVKNLLRHIQALDSSPPPDEKTYFKSQVKVSSALNEMKFVFYGDPENEPKPADVEKLVSLLFAQDVWILLLRHIQKFEFEAKKDVAQLFMFVLRRAQSNHAIDYVIDKPEIMRILVEGYNEPEIALNCGQILRECLRHGPLCEMLLKSEHFDLFFDFVQKANFDVASDAFATFKMMLTKHKEIASSFLLENYEHVISEYNQLIQSDNYVTKRQSLKLLGEVILDRSNFQVMMRYISDPENLKIMMNLLRESSKTIQFEGFHVFKVFVANPKKTKPVVEILLRNQTKLIEFLTKFRTDKDNEQFNEEKGILLTTLKKLKPEDVQTALAFNRQPRLAEQKS